MAGCLQMSKRRTSRRHHFTTFSHLVLPDSVLVVRIDRLSSMTNPCRKYDTHLLFLNGMLNLLRGHFHARLND
jgi:hypothetical protein